MDSIEGLARYRESCVPALTQERLAMLVGVHVNTVYAWERSGVSTAPRLLALARLFARLGVITDIPSAYAFWEACRAKPLVPPPELEELLRQPASALADAGPPPCSLIPLARNPRFVGRQGELERLALALQLPQAVVALVGMGGVGKSQLACEYSYRFGQRYPGGVFWLSFADPAHIPEEVARCGAAGALNLDPAFAQLPLDRQVQMVQMAWRQPTSRLLIFDSCEDPALLQCWRPLLGGCRVLVTSCFRAWPPTLLAEQIRLTGLARAESVQLLAAYLRFGEDDLSLASPETLDALSATLDDIPLALHLAGSYLALRQGVYAPEALVAELRAGNPVSHPALVGEGRSPTDGPEHLRVVLHRTYHLLRADQPRERLAHTVLLHAASFIPGEPISDDLLLGTVTHATGLEPEDRPALEEALALVVGRSLLQRGTDNTVRLHRLVALALRELHDYVAAQQAVVAALCDDLQAREERYTPVPLRDLHHLHAVARTVQAQAEEAAADLNRLVGFQLWLHRRPGAEPLLTWAASVYERELGADHVKVADTLSLLGLELQIRSRWAEARPLHERALAIRKRLLGPLHPSTAAAYNNLGYLQCWLADYAGARTHLHQALRLRAEQHGLLHADTARSIHNLGFLLLRSGRFASAHRFLHLALRLREQLLPAEHTATALSLSLLGECCTYLQNQQEALLLHERAIAMWQSLFGEQHPHVAEGLYRLAETQMALGRLEQAIEMLERARTIHHHCLTDELAVVDGIRVVERLGAALALRGLHERARPLLESSLDAWQQLFGDCHPLTAKGRYYLGMLTWSEGQQGMAQPLLTSAFEHQVTIFGPRHPDTVTTAALLAQLGQPSAMPSFEPPCR